MLVIHSLGRSGLFYLVTHFVSRRPTHESFKDEDSIVSLLITCITIYSGLSHTKDYFRRPPRYLGKQNAQAQLLANRLVPLNYTA
jgi:hypothetical protein